MSRNLKLTLVFRNSSLFFLLLTIGFVAELKGQNECQPSTNLRVSAITHHSAHVSWTPGSGTGFYVMFGSAGFIPSPIQGSGKYTAKNNLNLTFYSYHSGDTMDVYVRDSCGPNSHSNWAGPLRFVVGAWPDFAPAAFQLIPQKCKVLAIADVNNDFNNDVIIGTTFNSNASKRWKLMVYTQSNQGNLSNLPAVYSVGNDTLQSLEANDLNNDSKTDVLVAFGDSLALFLQSAGGQLIRDTTMYAGNRVFDIKAGDLNGDGLSDFATYNAGENTISVFYQDASAHFTAQTHSCPTSARGELEIGDFNNDGQNDLAVMTSKPPQLNIFHGQANNSLSGPGTFQSADSLPHIFEALAAGDISSNGLPDIVVSHRTATRAGDFNVWQQKPGPSFKYTKGLGGGQAINIGDLNCDGFQEMYSVLGKVLPNGSADRNLVGFSYFTPGDSVRRSFYHGTGGFSTPNIDYYHPKAIALGDLNGDHKPDLAIADTARGLVLYYNETEINPLVVSDSTTRVEQRQSFDTLALAGDTLRITTKDTTFGYYLYTTTTKIINELYQITTTITDSTKLEYKQYCDYYFYDSATYSYTQRDTSLLSTDTATSISEKREDWSEQDYNDLLAIFPNPTSGLVFIKILAVNDNLKTLQVEVFNDQGKLMISEKLQFTQQGEIDLSAFARATYRFRINWAGRIIERSVVKQ